MATDDQHKLEKMVLGYIEELYNLSLAINAILDQDDFDIERMVKRLGFINERAGSGKIDELTVRIWIDELRQLDRHFDEIKNNINNPDRVRVALAAIDSILFPPEEMLAIPHDSGGGTHD